MTSTIRGTALAIVLLLVPSGDAPAVDATTDPDSLGVGADSSATAPPAAGTKRARLSAPT